MKTLTVVIILLATIGPPVAIAADGPPALARNPFSRPPSEVLRTQQIMVDSSDGSGPAFALRATMVSRANRLANVAGKILKPGDEIDGYELVEVHEKYAVFRRGEKSMTVYVNPPAAEEDE